MKHGTSQNGEDLVIDCLLSLFGGRVAPYSVEIGVDAPEGQIECNTVHLLSRGWDGVLIDEDAIDHPRAVRQFITAENVGEVLRGLNVPSRPGVFSIDVDGMDYWIWKRLPTVFHPSLVVIEYNAEVSCDGERRVVAYDPDFRYDGVTSYFGASAAALVDLAHSRGYRLVAEVRHVNLVFVSELLLDPGFREPPVERLGGRIVGPARGDPLAREREWVILP